jgi:hypothetical protein
MEPEDGMLNEKERKEHKEFREYISMRHKMFSGTDSSKWVHECLKMIERKVLYYFNVTSDLKKNQGYQEFADNVKTFETYFKLSELEYEFNKYRHVGLEGKGLSQNTNLIDYYLKTQGLGEEVEEAKLGKFKGKISPEYMPIFNYLCQKIEQKALFNQKGLVIFARARTIVCDDRPYIFSRRRTLLTDYLGQVFSDKALKISYCSLTDKTFNLFEVTKNNYKCEVLCLILTIDAVSAD